LLAHVLLLLRPEDPPGPVLAPPALHPDDGPSENERLLEFARENDELEKIGQDGQLRNLTFWAFSLLRSSIRALLFFLLRLPLYRACSLVDDIFSSVFFSSSTLFSSAL
jgi:hypothetical protein